MTLNFSIPSQAFEALTEFTMSSNPSDPNTPFMNINVEAAFRLRNMSKIQTLSNNSEGQDQSVVLLVTSVGRLVVDGSGVSPASGSLEVMNLTELYNLVLEATPFNQANGGESRSFYGFDYVDLVSIARTVQSWLA